MSLDISKFSFFEMFNNASGKTSATKFVGTLTSVVCLLLFIILVVFYFFNPAEAATVLLLIDKTTVYFSIAAGLMGIKSVSSAIGNSKIKIGKGSSLTQQVEDSSESVEQTTEEEEG